MIVCGRRHDSDSGEMSVCDRGHDRWRNDSVAVDMTVCGRGHDSVCQGK